MNRLPAKRVSRCSAAGAERWASYLDGTLALTALAASVFAGSAAWSEEPAEPSPPAPAEEASEGTGPVPFDRFMVRGGWGHVFSADTVITLNGEIGGIGTTVDFAETLDGRRTDDSWRIDALIRLNERHALGFSYYDVQRRASRVLDTSIEVDDTIFVLGAKVESELDISLYRLLYNYSFYHSETAELGLSLGMYAADIEAGISGDLTCRGIDVCDPMQPLVADSAGRKLTVPLPSVGAIVNYDILPPLQAQVRFDWFYLEVDKFVGSMFEFYAGLEYRPFEHFGLGAAYDRLDIDVSNRRGRRDGWEIRNDWNMVFLYGALYF